MPNNEPTSGTPDLAPPLGVDEAPHPLRHYAGVLRRRWRWIALGVLLGLLAGIASTFVADKKVDTTTYYKATNTLVINGGASSSSADTSNLPQVALFIRSAEVVNGVAEKAGIDAATAGDLITAVAVPEVSAIDVTAISTDPQQAAELADTAAAVLSDFVTSDQQSQYTAERDSILKQIDDLTSRRNELQARVGNPPDPTVQAQLDEVVNEIRVANEQLSLLAGKGGAPKGFSSLQSATPIQINARAFNTRLAANRDARAGTSVTVTGSNSASSSALSFSETDLSTTAPVSKRTRVLIGLGTGLVLGIITAFAVEAWDDRLRRRQRAEAVTGLPVIAEVPVLSKDLRRRDDSLVVMDAASSRAAESIRSARSSILFLLNRQRMSAAAANGNGSPLPNVIMVTSPNPGEGKTTTAANLAAAFGDIGVRTLIVDCDYHSPKLDRRLGVEVDPANLGAPSSTRVPNVWFLPAPPSGVRPAEAVAALRATIAHWRTEYEMVVLDTPPMLTTNDAVELLDSANSVVLVVRAGQTRSGPAGRASQILGLYDTNVLGVVLNGVAASEMEDGYGYGYSYGYYRDDARSATTTTVVTPEPADGPAPSDTGTPGPTAAAPDDPTD